jgi:hypothetical protein
MSAAASEGRLLSGKRSHLAILQGQPCKPLIEGSFREAAAAAFDIAYCLGRLVDWDDDQRDDFATSPHRSSRRSPAS